MSNAKDKDRILAELNVRKPHYEIEGLNEVLPELEADGYVDVWWDEQHKPIRVKLSDKGRCFLDQGGYSKLKRKRIRATVWKVGKWLLVTLAGAALIELATQAVRSWILP